MKEDLQSMRKLPKCAPMSDHYEVYRLGAFTQPDGLGGYSICWPENPGLGLETVAQV